MLSRLAAVHTVYLGSFNGNKPSLLGPLSIAPAI